MSLAWLHINNALLSLTGPEPQRERLFRAYTESLSKLRRKDLPSEIEHVFNTLSSHFSACVWAADRKSVQTTILAMDDGEISAIIQYLIHMHRVVASYQAFSESQQAS